MKKIERFYKYANSIFVVIVVLIEEQVIQFVEHLGIKNNVLVYVISIITLITLFKIMEWTVEQLLEKVCWIRKLLLGEDYIEGVWLDKVEINKEKFYSLIHINYEDGMYYINGEQFFDNRVIKCSWHTISSRYENNSLKTIYETTHYCGGKNETFYGLSVYNFSINPQHTSPETFSGFFFDTSSSLTNSSFHGYKIVDKNELEMLRDPQKRIVMLKQYMESY